MAGFFLEKLAFSQLSLKVRKTPRKGEKYEQFEGRIQAQASKSEKDLRLPCGCCGTHRNPQI
jgi:hypothetical protein